MKIKLIEENEALCYSPQFVSTHTHTHRFDIYSDVGTPLLFDCSQNTKGRKGKGFVGNT